MPYEDKTIACSDCGEDFIHSAEDQARYAERGFTNEPKRCRGCREKRKAERPGGRGGYGGGGRPGDRGAGRPPRESFDVVCDGCGAETTVPFKPTQDRPVYCRDCYQKQRGGS